MHERVVNKAQEHTKKILEVTSSVSRNEKHPVNNHFCTDTRAKSLFFCRLDQLSSVLSKADERKVTTDIKVEPMKDIINFRQWGRGQ
jgi:hypothetical protein